MRLSMNKDDICEPIEIPKENWSEFLSTIIKGSIRRDDVIGSNLKQQCINYFEQLETNRDEVIELLSKGVAFCENDSQGNYDICNIAINREKKAIEILERGKDEKRRNI